MMVDDAIDAVSENQPSANSLAAFTTGAVFLGNAGFELEIS